MKYVLSLVAKIRINYKTKKSSKLLLFFSLNEKYLNLEPYLGCYSRKSILTC